MKKNDALKIENVELKYQLKTGENVFKNVMVEHSRKVTTMRNTMEKNFQTLAHEFHASLTFLNTWRKK